MTTEEILENLSGVEGTHPGSVRIYLKTFGMPQRGSASAHGTARQHLIAAVHAGGETGYAESIITVNEPEVSLTAAYSGRKA